MVCSALGADMYDCVYPTRTARFGTALVPEVFNLSAERSENAPFSSNNINGFLHSLIVLINVKLTKTFVINM